MKFLKVFCLNLLLLHNLYAELSYQNICTLLIKKHKYKHYDLKENLKKLYESCNNAVSEAKHNDQKIYYLLISNHYNQIPKFIKTHKVYSDSYEDIALAYMLLDDMNKSKQFYKKYINSILGNKITIFNIQDFISRIKLLKDIYPKHKDLIEKNHYDLLNMLKKRKIDDKKCKDEIYPTIFTKKIDLNKLKHIVDTCIDVNYTKDVLIELLHKKLPENDVCNYIIKHPTVEFSNSPYIDLACATKFYIADKDKKLKDLLKRYKNKIDNYDEYRFKSYLVYENLFSNVDLILSHIYKIKTGSKKEIVKYFEEAVKDNPIVNIKFKLSENEKLFHELRNKKKYEDATKVLLNIIKLKSMIDHDYKSSIKYCYDFIDYMDLIKRYDLKLLEEKNKAFLTNRECIDDTSISRYIGIIKYIKNDLEFMKYLKSFLKRKKIPLDTNREAEYYRHEGVHYISAKKYLKKYSSLQKEYLLNKSKIDSLGIENKILENDISDKCRSLLYAANEYYQTSSIVKSKILYEKFLGECQNFFTKNDYLLDKFHLLDIYIFFGKHTEAKSLLKFYPKQEKNSYNRYIKLIQNIDREVDKNKVIHEIENEKNVILQLMLFKNIYYKKEFDDHLKSVLIYKIMNAVNRLNYYQSIDFFNIYFDYIYNYTESKDRYDYIKHLDGIFPAVKQYYFQQNNLKVILSYYINKIKFMKYKQSYESALNYFNKIIYPFIEQDTYLIFSNQEKINLKIFYAELLSHTNETNRLQSFINDVFTSFVVLQSESLSKLNKKERSSYLKTDKHNLSKIIYIFYNTKPKNDAIKKFYNNWIRYKGSGFEVENIMSTIYTKTDDKALKHTIMDYIIYSRKLAKLYQTLPKPNQKEIWSKRIKKIESKRDHISKEIASRTESFKEQLGLKDITYKDIAKYLKPNELYIDFAKTDDNYYVFTLDSKSTIAFKGIDSNDTKKIDSQILSFRDDIKKLVNDKLTAKEIEQLTTKSKEKLAKLYELLLKPIKSKLKDKSILIISTDGALRLLPFEILYNQTNNTYLIESKEIKYIPNAKELVRLYKYAQKSSSSKNVIFDNPDFNIKLKSKNEDDASITPNTNRTGIVKSLFKMYFTPLPGTQKEAEHIKQKLKNTIEFTKKEASEDNLLKIKEPKILHIATHGFFLNDKSIKNPMLKSGIALAGANTSAIKGKSDGIVTSLKLAGLDLKGTDLVVLSACETGVVDINSTESVSALGKAFIQAGTKDVVMSLWSVDDNATAELMNIFYDKIKQENRNYAQALQKAKIEMIQKNIHPFYWAAFVINGL